MLKSRTSALAGGSSACLAACAAARLRPRGASIAQPGRHRAGQARLRPHEQGRAGQPVEAGRRVRHGRCAAGVLRHQAQPAAPRLARGRHLRRGRVAAARCSRHFRTKKADTSRPWETLHGEPEHKKAVCERFKSQARRVLQDHERADRRGRQRVPQLLLLLRLARLSAERRSRRSTSAGWRRASLARGGCLRGRRRRCRSRSGRRRRGWRTGSSARRRARHARRAIAGTISIAAAHQVVALGGACRRRARRHRAKRAGRRGGSLGRGDRRHAQAARTPCASCRAAPALSGLTSTASRRGRSWTGSTVSPTPLTNAGRFSEAHRHVGAERGRDRLPNRRRRQRPDWRGARRAAARRHRPSRRRCRRRWAALLERDLAQRELRRLLGEARQRVCRRDCRPRWPRRTGRAHCSLSPRRASKRTTSPRSVRKRSRLSSS